jgi:hypothetical protein
MSLWNAIPASDLIDCREDGTLAEEVPPLPGLYLWRRRYVASQADVLGPEEFVQWVIELCRQANARLPSTTISHCVHTDGIRIGGGDIPQDKLRVLENISGQATKRRHLAKIVQELSAFTPPIYVGETNNLRRRLREHLDGSTGLYSYVNNVLGLDWADLDFCYLNTAPKPVETANDPDEPYRQTCELIAQRLLAPFAVKRPG